MVDGIKSLFAGCLGQRSHSSSSDNSSDSSSSRQRRELIKRGYNPEIEKIRRKEYPQLKGETYLDHSGATIYCRALITSHKNTLLTQLFGNPHSANPSSAHSARVESAARRAVLEFFNASPDAFDVVFTANATAALKLVAESLSGHPDGFEYRFHRDAHTSLIGVREYADNFHCMERDEDVERWLDLDKECSPVTVSSVSTNSTASPERLGLFAYPLQSNFDGKRMPRSWPKKVRESHPSYLTLVDAAAYAMTSPLNVDELDPDFLAVSFYKIFGYPDLGCLILRRSAAHLLRARRYFGGGTIGGLLADEKVHMLKEDVDPHVYLEDGTLPFHAISALGDAIRIHGEIYGSMDNISKHATALASFAHNQLCSLTYDCGAPLVQMYSAQPDPRTQGSVLTFNILPKPAGISNTDPEKDASCSISCSEKDDKEEEQMPTISFTAVEQALARRRIHVRAGRHCNIGGLHRHLGLDSDILKRAYAAGVRCNGKNDLEVLEGRVLGAVRVSFGAMSSIEDVKILLKGLREEYL